MANEYIVRLKTKYKDMILKEQEKKSIEEWKKELEKKETEDSSASAMHEKEENIRDKESEREA